MKKYDWNAAEKAVRNAQRELFAAQRHINHRKRVNVLNDLLAAESDLRKVWTALRPVTEGADHAD